MPAAKTTLSLKVLKENKHTLSEWMEKGKSPFRLNSQHPHAANRNHAKVRNHKKNFVSSRSRKEFYWCTLFHFISENEIIHILIYFIKTHQVHQVGLEQESPKYGNATKKGRTSNKIRSNTKLPLGALNKILKTQASEISP